MENLMSEPGLSFCPSLSVAPSKLPIELDELKAGLIWHFILQQPVITLAIVSFTAFLILAEHLVAASCKGGKTSKIIRPAWTTGGLKIKGCDVCIINLFEKYIKRSRYSTPSTGLQFIFISSSPPGSILYLVYNVTLTLHCRLQRWFSRLARVTFRLEF